MKKIVVFVGVAAVLYGAFSLVKALQNDEATARGPAGRGGLAIAPATAFVNSTLQARLESRRGSGADPGACRWFVNETEVPGATAATLGPGHFKKGDAVRVKAVADGSTLVSETVVIANTPPKITNASADLKAEPSAEIVLRVAAVDADDDPIRYRYEWFKNGQRVEGQTDSKIDVSHFKKGDRVHANVVASDPESSTAPYKSDPIELGSNAPKITSTPPQVLGDDRLFVYQVKVASGSGSLKYELLESPEGMRIDGGGRIEWTVPVHESPDDARRHRAVVRVTDPMGGYTTQEFSITTSLQTGSAGE